MKLFVIYPFVFLFGIFEGYRSMERGENIRYMIVEGGAKLAIIRLRVRADSMNAL